MKSTFEKMVKSKEFLMVVCVVIFASLSVYVYIQYVDSKMNPGYKNNKEFIKKESTNKFEIVDLYFFYTSWCPHCKTAFPIWKTLKENNEKIKGTTINYIEIDCDKDTKTAEKFKVEGYPTIKLVKGNTIIEYDAKPDLDTLLQFLDTSI